MPYLFFDTYRLYLNFKNGSSKFTDNVAIEINENVTMT